jgi:hypothetical protein
MKETRKWTGILIPSKVDPPEQNTVDFELVKIWEAIAELAWRTRDIAKKLGMDVGEPYHGPDEHELGVIIEGNSGNYL